MTGPDRTDRIDTATIRTALALLDIPVLAISRAREHADRLVVYIHGNAGRTRQREAIAALRRLRGVAAVEASDASWTIVHVDLTPSPRGRREPDMNR